MVTYSSKTSVMVFVFLLTLTAESLIEAITNTGAKLSRGPPPGGIMLAQEETAIIVTSIPLNNKICVNGCFMYGKYRTPCCLLLKRIVKGNVKNISPPPLPPIHHA